MKPVTRWSRNFTLPYIIDTVASLPFHVEVLYGCALTKHVNVASKTATDEKKPWRCILESL